MELSPPNGRTQWAVVAVLTVVACALRWSLAVDGALDVDAINLGLAARDFDVLQYRPHPPGYAGYVLLLKMLGLLAPGAAAVELACLGSLVCGAASVPAAYWAARQMAGADAWSGPLAAAALAAVNPVLWYYGADGQSHAAEGLATLLVFGLVVRAHHRHTRAAVVLAVAALALAGGLRPNIVALGAPLAVWLLWRRPAADWFLSLGAAALACLAWAWPSMAAAGGLDSYRRASEALYGAYLGSYSVGGELAVVNLSKALWSLVWAGPPLLVLCWRGLAAAPWRLPWLAVLLAHLSFFAGVYIAEPGYLAGVAALLCLAPAAWPAGVTWSCALRLAAAVTASLLMVLAGPAEVPRPRGREPALTLARVAQVEAGQRAYRALVCGAASRAPALAVTDNVMLTHTRLLALTCPRLQVAVLLLRPPLNPGLDNWLIFRGRHLQSLPTPVPLEPGPPVTAALAEPVTRVIVAPDASPALAASLAHAARCAAQRSENGLAVYPARCLPVIRVGGNVLKVTR